MSEELPLKASQAIWKSASLSNCLKGSLSHIISQSCKGKKKNHENKDGHVCKDEFIFSARFFVFYFVEH